LFCADVYSTERLLGGLDVFLPYIHDYVKTFRGQAIRTPQWKSHLYEYFEKNGGKEKIDLLNSIKWNVGLLSLLTRILSDPGAKEWLNGEGLDLPEKIEYDTSLAAQAYALAKKWDDARNIDELDFKPSDLDGFNSNQICERPLQNLLNQIISKVVFPMQLFSWRNFNPFLPLCQEI